MADPCAGWGFPRESSVPCLNAHRFSPAYDMSVAISKTAASPHVNCCSFSTRNLLSLAVNALQHGHPIIPQRNAWRHVLGTVSYTLALYNSTVHRRRTSIIVSYIDRGRNWPVFQEEDYCDMKGVLKQSNPMSISKSYDKIPPVANQN